MLHRPFYRLLGRFLAKHDRRRLATKILMNDSFQYSIENASLVNSRSILFACSIHPKNPQSSQENIAYLDSILGQIQAQQQSADSKKNLSIYIPSDGIPYFIRQVAPQITRPYTLVTGDSDLPINESTLGSDLQILLEMPVLQKWFAQNRDYEHPKLSSLPIGINLHNLWSNPLEWGGGFILPALQELELQTIAENAPSFADREAKIFCNWHFSIDRADRQDCFNRIDKSVCFFQANPLPTSDTWKLQSRYQFVLSPHGAGLDCHRTWEALLLGCIPIVKKAKLNDLFVDLPVIAVEDWSEINSAFLKKAAEEMASKNINREKLFMRYWKAQIQS